MLMLKKTSILSFNILLAIVIALTPSAATIAQIRTPRPPLGQFLSSYLPATQHLAVLSADEPAVFDSQKLGLSADGGRFWTYFDNYNPSVLEITSLAFSPSFEIDQTILALWEFPWLSKRSIRIAMK